MGLFSSISNFVRKEVLDDVLGIDMPDPAPAPAAPTVTQVLPTVVDPQTGEAVEVDVPTQSYLETQGYLALQRQKALVKGLKRSGIESAIRSKELAGMQADKQISLTPILVLGIVILGLKLWT